MIDIQKISFGYHGQPVLDKVTFQVAKGELFGIIGPNGSGKTTLLKIISNILPLQAGDIYLQEQPLSSYHARDFAKLVAVLPQHTTQTFGYTVKETVTLGRYAHQKGLFPSLSKTDGEIIQEVMEHTGVSHYQDMPLDTLSGGEKQRVFLAQALAQQPQILLLDEPTNHLDLTYQKELMDLIKKWTITHQLTVISIFHELNIASLYCDRLLLLDHGKMVACDTPNNVLKTDNIAAVYHTEVGRFPHSEIPKPQVMLMPGYPLKKDKPIIDEHFLQQSKDMITMTFPYKLKAMSSGVTGAGLGWYQTFVNRHVDKDYLCDDYIQDMVDFLQERGMNADETVGMMTAVKLDDVSYRTFESGELSIFVVVTAGTGNAVNAIHGDQHGFTTPGTINTWIFVNGKLSDVAFLQCVVTATEAKVTALREMGIMDRVTQTYATGTSTDSILIAATQEGGEHAFGGTITPLGSLVARGVYTCLKEALQHYQNRID